MEAHDEAIDQPIPEIPEIPETEQEETEQTQAPETAESAENATEAAETHESPTDEELAAAERRGYLRGRNEAIARMMEEPQLFADLARMERRDGKSRQRGDATEDFLTHIRPQVWD